MGFYRNFIFRSGLAVLVLLAFFVTTASADIYWESLQVVKGKGWPTRKKTIRSYFTMEKSRMDIGSNVMIADFRSMTGYVLDSADKKYLEIQMNDVGKIPEGLRQEARVQATNVTRRIAGYKCRKYKVSFMNKEYEQWLSKEVKGYRQLKQINDRLSSVIRQNPLFKMGIVGKMDQLDGFPVQTVMPMSGGRTKIITLKRVLEKPLDNSVFRVPPGYKSPQ